MPKKRDKVTNHVRQYRQAGDMTQLTLSRLADITPAAVCGIELGDRMPGIATALKLARALRVKVEDLFVLEKEE